MQEIKGNNASARRGGYPARKIAAKKVATPEYKDEMDEAPAPAAKRAARKRLPDAVELPSMIRVNPHEVSGIVHGSVFRQSAFKWEPQAFAAESDKLNDKILEPSVQDRSLRLFLEDPTIPMIYAIAGNPDDSKAKLFAAFLVAHHCRTLRARAQVKWETLYGGFQNRLLEEYEVGDLRSDPSLIVISNLTPTSTAVKIEKARDLLERFTEVPRLVVIAGEDPLSFMTTRLFSQVNGLAYFSDALVRKKVEII